ncbi:MAG: cyclase family protein [Clostridia bacterium]|nr:cyclase family protein [Clostridia bacterium]
MWHDITKPLQPGMTVYPGDPAFELRTERHDIYKVSSIAMCVHCGTHIDAPSHFLLDGDTDDYPVSRFCGEAVVLDWREGWPGDVQGCARVLLKGGSGLSEDEAREAAEAGVALIGTDRLSIAPFDHEAATHIALLSRGVCILENADLAGVKPGKYRLLCLPMRLKGAEGAPVRAFLIDEA